MTSVSDAILYQDTNGNTISPAIAILNGTTYSVANITSVRAGSKPPPAGGIIVLAVGAFILALVHVWVMAVIFAALAVAFLAKAKTMFLVVVGTTAGEKTALGSPDVQVINNVVAALNQAIASR